MHSMCIGLAIDRLENFQFLAVPMPNQHNDQALAHIEQVCAGAMDTLPPIWRRTLAYPCSQGNSRDDSPSGGRDRDYSERVWKAA
jgi:hypothetical protein